MTVHGTCSPFSLKIWVMPSLRPIIPIMSQTRGARGSGVRGSGEFGVGSCRAAFPTPPNPSLHLDLDVHTSREIELRQRVHRLRARIENVDDALVGLQLELLPRLLVDVRRTEHRPPLRL